MGRLMTAVTIGWLAGASRPATAATCNWTNTAGGHWNTATNWSPNQVPGAADTAIITAGGAYSVSLDVNPAIAGLVLGASSGGTTQTLFTANQTLTVNGPIQVNAQGQFMLNGGGLAGTNLVTGALSWSGGSLAGNLTLGTNSVLNIVAGGGNGFNGLALTNYGTVNWTNTTLYSLNNHNAQIYNYGVWNAQSDNTFVGGNNGGTTLFDNFGTFAKTGNSGGTTLDGSVVFNNTGIVSAQSGTLNLSGGGTISGGECDAAGAGKINLSGFLLTNAVAFNGPGTYVAGNASFAGIVAGTLNWDGGSLAGNLTLSTNSVLNIVAGGGDGFNGLILTNYGTVNWTNTPLYSLNNHNAQIYNYGVWNAQSDNTFVGGNNGGTSLFDNFGTFLKSGRTGTTTLDGGVVFNNAGAVSAASGTLAINGGTANGGVFDTTGGGYLNLANYLLTNSVLFSGPGSAVSGGATFAGTVVGTLTWSGGSVNGALTVASNSVFNIGLGGNNGLLYGLALTNYGTVNWTNTTLYGESGKNAQFYNYGVWTAQSDNTFVGGNNGGTSLFDNFGTFVKTGNSGSTVLDGGVVFNNTGTVSALSGTLSIEGGGVNSSSGTFTTANGAFLNLDNLTFANSATISSGTVVDLGGSTTINGVLTGSNLQLVSGTLAGTNVIVGTLTWSGGSLAGALTVASNSVLNIVAGGGDGFNGLVLTNYGTVNWSNATLYGINNHNAQIYNYGVWNVQSDNAFNGGWNGGSTLFNNYGTFVKTGNSGGTTLDGSVVFNNTGIVSAQSGTLSLNGGGTISGGECDTAGAGKINLSGFLLTNTVVFNGVGTSVAGNASFAGIVTGTLNWEGGSLAGNLTLSTNSVLNIVAGGGDGFNGLVLTNYGTVNWTNTTLYSLNNHNAQIYNYGVWNAQSDNTFVGGNNGGTSLFDNFGTFLKSGRTGTTTLDGGVVFNNAGAVSAASGTLAINGGTASGGGFDTTGGGYINLASYVLTNSVLFSGPGGAVSGGATFAGTVVGTLTWSGGSLNGVLTVASNSVFNIGLAGHNGLFYGLALTNYGTVNWTNTALYGESGKNAQIYNYGVWTAQSDNTFVGGNNGGTSLFDNFGTFVKTGNSGSTVLDGGVVFNNTGTVSALSGTLSIEGGGVNSSSGTFTTANGAFLNLDNLTFANSATISSGTVVDLGGSTTINGVLTGSNLQLVSGTLAGTNVIVGTLTWSGGSLAGALTVASNSVLNIVAGGGDGFNGLVLTNYGTVNWSNATLYGINNHNAQIYNYGVWNVQSDNAFNGGWNGGSTLFNNYGTFVKTGNSGGTTLDGSVVFNNTGIVSAQSGTLSLNGGGTISGGECDTAGGGNINLLGYLLTNTVTFNGPGTYVAGNASFAGIVAGTLNWDGGSLAGNLTLSTNSVLNIVAGGGDGFNGLVLTNYGTVNWTNTPLYGINNHNAQIYNYGVWNAQSDSTFVGGNNGGTSLFDNFGTFVKTGHTGTTTLDGGVVFSNAGTLSVQSGTLTLQGSHSLGTGNLNFGLNSATNFGVLSLAGAVTLTGTVTVDFNNGFVPVQGAQFPVLSCASLTGALDAGNLPVGLAPTYSSTQVTLVENGVTEANWAAGDYALHGTGSAAFVVYPGTTVQLIASAGGVSRLLGATSGSGLQTINFDTTALASGHYSLRAVFLNASSLVVGDYSRSVFVNNSLAWHEGTLSASQTWGSNVVNAVDQNIIIPSGVTLTIAPGAVVKFAKGAGIVIQPGGILDASGATVAAPIIFTSMADDSAGGDSNEDGSASVPLVGDWNGIGGAGQFQTSTSVQIRYVIQPHSGVLAGSQEWSGSVGHLVTGNVTVPSGITLTIDPGAIIKVGLGLNLTVQSGGRLVAAGTVAQPIIFTSVNDQNVGADTNTVPTSPLAGDWDSIYFNGGTGTFDHVSISYGGGPDANNSGLISLTAPGSVVTISDSTLNQGFYKGIQAEYGTVNVTNCLVTGCERGIQSGLSGPTVVTVVNCTLDSNSYGLVAHGGVLNVANTIVADSLLYGVTYCCGSSLTNFEHCDVWSPFGPNYAGTSDQTGLNGNISVNPSFVNAAQGNYELNYLSPCIDAGDGLAATPSDLTGAPRYNDPRTVVKTGIPNAGGLYADMGAFEFVETASSPVDLVVIAVAGPSAETAGQTVTVQWQDANLGTANAVGPWHDTISLVPQGGGSPLVVGTVLVAQNIVLGPGQSYPTSASVVVPGGVAGVYQWQVHVNSQGDVFEGVHWTNNTTLSSASSTLADPALTLGGPAQTNLLTAVGQSGVFSVVSAGGPFVLNAQGNPAGCALEVFVGDGYVPGPSQFDFKSSQFDSATASVTVPSNNHDTYYVVVYAASLGGGQVSYTLSATPLVFAVNSVSPSTIANAGAVTLQVMGDQLATNDTYTLIGPGGAFAASAVLVSDPTVAYATFNLGGAAAGLYSLQISPPSGPALALTNAVMVTSGGSVAAAASLSLHLELPPGYRQSRPFGGTIIYGDAGGVDMPAPLLVLTNDDSAGMAVQGSTKFVTGPLILVGASFEGPAGTLTPGNTWNIGFTAVASNLTTVNFGVTPITVNATNLVDYSALAASLQPTNAPCALQNWTNAWARLEALAGPTWGEFVTLIDFYATQMAATGAPGDFYVLDDVLSYALSTNGWCAVVAHGGGFSPPGGGGGGGSGGSSSGRRSSDPNDKFSTGVGGLGWVAAGDPISYTVEFENQPSATAPAQTVTITDPLSPNLDWSTLQLTEVSFNNVALPIASGVQSFSAVAEVATDPNPVSVTVSLDPVAGVLTWQFQSIDPVTGLLVTDPLAGFLPPDNTQAQGYGYVTFTVRPKGGLATGTQITNQASIVFDVNAPIVTPTTTNTLDVTPPTSAIAALPAESTPTIAVSWSGSDMGSGIAGFNIYVSTNGGPWTPWLVGTTNTSATFAGRAPNTYAFYSIAYDEVGNVEPHPTIPGATTTSTMVNLTIAPSSGGMLTVTWPQGTLLQATTPNGPWTTNTAASPYTFAPGNPQAYFRVRVQ